VTNWGWVGWILALIGIALSATSHLRGRPKKQLEWRPRLHRLDHGAPGDDTVTVLHNETPVEHPIIVRVRFYNAGRAAIAESDIRQVPKVTLLNGIILTADATVLEDDRTLDMTISDDRTSAELAAATFLNSGERIDVQLLCDSDNVHALKVDGKILGEHRPIRRRTQYRNSAIWQYTGFGLALALGAMSTVAGKASEGVKPKDMDAGQLTLNGLTLLLFVALFASIILHAVTRQRAQR
jgi:hypothetical protein